MKNSKRILLYLQDLKNSDGTKKPILKELLANELRLFMSRGKFYDSLYLLRARGAVFFQRIDIDSKPDFSNPAHPIIKQKGTFKGDYYIIADKQTRYELRINNEVPINRFEIYDLKKQRVHLKFHLDITAKKVVEELNKNSFWF